MNNQPPSVSESPLPDWPAGGGIQTPPPHKSPSRIKKLLLAGGILFALILVGTIVLAWQNNTNCLTIDDYLELSDDNHHDKESFDPTNDFYVTTFTFAGDSNKLDGEYADISIDEVTKIAQFYKKYSQKPMVFKVTALYNTSVSTTNDQKELAQERADTIKRMLTDAEIPSEIITASASSYSVGNDEERPDDNNLATLSVRSAVTCK